MERHRIVVVGGGQAGLALSHHLQERGLEHVILERGRIAERWRSQRWDSLMFQFPNWSIRLPGCAYATADPEAFAPRDEVVRFLEHYAALVRAPVRTGVNVRALRQRTGGGFVLETDTGDVRANIVVLATGPYQAPAFPSVADAVGSSVFQVHSSAYRSPNQLPPGAVLVVGSGSSGCQIAEDLAAAGRRVHLSVGRHRRLPRRYRGRDVFWWLDTLGLLDRPVDDRGDARRTHNPLFTGVDGGHEIDLRAYPARGIALLGHLRGASDGVLAFAADLEAELSSGDEGRAEFIRAVDAHVARVGLDAPAEEPPAPAPPVGESPCALDLRATSVSAIVWATGYRFDFGWVRIPVLDDSGAPRHRRGVTPVEGLYALGLPWLWTLKSSTLCGVGDDAAYLAERIAAATAVT